MASSAWVCRLGMYSRLSSRRRPRQRSAASSTTRPPYSATAAMDTLMASALDARQASVARLQLQAPSSPAPAVAPAGPGCVHSGPPSRNCANGLRKDAYARIRPAGGMALVWEPLGFQVNGCVPANGQRWHSAALVEGQTVRQEVLQGPNSTASTAVYCNVL